MERIIDLRSDTVTQPTPAMRAAMMAAPLGDDVFNEDPTVRQLEEKAAAIFGKEAGLFCPSGTMTNQIGIKMHTQPGDEVICEATSHVYQYEGGGIAFHSGASAWLLQGDRGRITADQVAEAIRGEADYYPRTSLVVIENTHNRGGGSMYALDEMQAISASCRKHGLKLHLDGARIFNALTEAGYHAAEIGSLVDSISVCLSKGLGAPAGSVLLGSADAIRTARRIRKVMGGGMRQSGILAAAGIYALDHHIAGLKDDHRRAKTLGRVMADLPFVIGVMPVDTNIVVSHVEASFELDAFLAQLAAQKIKAVPFGKKSIRMVTHYDFDDDQLQYVCDTLRKFS